MTRTGTWTHDAQDTRTAEYNALSHAEKRVFRQAQTPGEYTDHAKGMAAVEWFRGTEAGRQSQRNSLTIDEGQAYRKAAAGISDPVQAHEAGMATVSAMREHAAAERVRREAEQKAQRERADAELARAMAADKAKAADLGLDLDPSRPQKLVRQNGKTIGILEGHVKDQRRDGGTRSAGIDEKPDFYVSRVSGSYTPGRSTEVSVTRKKHATLDEALAHVKQRHTTDRKRAEKDLRSGLFAAPAKVGRSSKPPAMGEGELGGPITFEGGRTGTVWGLAPDNGKWVIPDDRFEGEAHAIYVDKKGEVDHRLSSRTVQADWLAARKAQVAASTPAARQAREAQQKKLADMVEQYRNQPVKTVSARPFKDLSDEELSQVDSAHGHAYVSKNTSGLPFSQRGSTTIHDVVQRERDFRSGEAKVADYRTTALADVSPGDRNTYYAAYQRYVQDGWSPEKAHRQALDSNACRAVQPSVRQSAVIHSTE